MDLEMRIHLVSVVGASARLLPHMLAHYCGLGIESFLIHAHVSRADDPVLGEIQRITDEFGCGIASVTIGPWTQDVNPALYARSRNARPEDWFVMADQDELQEYPRDLRTMLEECESRGFDYIEGGFLDRLSADGTFPEVAADRALGEQFPLGGFLSTPILDANPNKVVAAKGHVGIAPGQHWATSGRGWPADEMYVPVHHFKWVGGVVQSLEKRAAFYKSLGDPLCQESARFLDYCRLHNDRIDITDPLLWIAPCSPSYPHWQTLTSLCRQRAKIAFDPNAPPPTAAPSTR